MSKTLREMYIIRMDEINELRREIKRLKKEASTSPSQLNIQERRLLEEKIRKHESALKKTERERDRYHRLWQEAARRASDYSAEQLILIEDLKAENARLLSENSSLKASLQEALDTIAVLKIQMNRDYENSSIPSSQKPFHKKIKNSREKTDRKPGAQAGHPGYRRPHMEPTQPVVFLEATPEMQADPDLYPTSEFIIKQKVDIHVTVSVTEYRAQVYRSRSTGRRSHAPFPEGVVNEFNYGENAKALAFLLNNYCNVSIDKTSELISGLTSGEIHLSKGMINNLPAQFSASTEEDRQRIYHRLLLAPSMNIDFTPGRVNGTGIQVVFCGNGEESLYLYRDSKGHKGVAGTPAEEYQHILIHDHDSTFYSYGADHQECLAHILRYLQNAIENEPDLTYHRSMQDLLKQVIHEAKQERHFTESRIREIEAAYDEIVKTGEKEYEEHPPSKYYPDGYNLFERLQKYKHNHLLFLRHPEIEYTNNLAERSLRLYKRKQRQAVTFRSKKAVMQLCDCLSILETHRHRGSDIFHTAKEVFS